jgi:hypothetical protein
VELWFDSLSQLLYGASIIALLFWLSQRSTHGFLRCFGWLCAIEAIWLANTTLQREEWRLLWLVLSSIIKGAALFYVARRWPLQEMEPPKMKGITRMMLFLLLALGCLFFGRLLAPFYRINGDILSITALFCVSALFSVIVHGTVRLQLVSLSVLHGGLLLLSVHLNPQLPILWSFVSVGLLVFLFVRHSLEAKDAAVAEA